MDLAVNSGDTDAVLTSDRIACDQWTTFEVMNNKLKLVAQEGGSFASDQVYAFENVRFLVSSGVLRADVALSFTTGADNKRQVCGCPVSVAVVVVVVPVIAAAAAAAAADDDRSYSYCIFRCWNCTTFCWCQGM